MAAAETPIVDLTNTTTAIKESNSKLDYAAEASAKENKKVVESIGNWAKSNEMKLDGLAMTNLSGNANQMAATVAALTANMESQKMGSGEMYDELKSMHIGLADAFEQQYNFDVARWRTEKEMLDEANRKKTDIAEGKEVTDLSAGFSMPVIGILAAVAGFITGFFQGFFGPIKKMIMKPLTFAWKSFKAIIKDSAIGKWYRLVKGWFTLAQVDAKTGKFTPSKWKNFKTFLKDNAIINFYKKVKGWFTSKATIGKEWMKIKDFFKGKGFKMPAWLTKVFGVVKAAKNAIFPLFKSIGTIFGRLFFWVQIIMAAFDFASGYTETQGGIWDKIWGGFSKAIKNFFGAFLDLGIMLEDAIKWVIKKIAGFFGFDEKEVGAMMEGFSIFGPIKDGLNAVVDWIVKLMTDPLQAFSEIWAGVKSIGTWIYDKAIKPVWDKIKSFFSFAAAEVTGTETWKTLTEFISGIWTKVKTWITGMLSWASTEDEKDSFIVKTVKGAITLAKKWLTSMFKFDSTSDILASAFNALTFLPNLVWKGLTAVSSWLAGLLGFNDAAKKIANAGEFSLGDMLFNALKGIWEWIKSKVDVGKIASNLSDGLFGGDTKAEASLKSLGISQATGDIGDWDIMDQEAAIRKAAATMNVSQLQKMASAIKSVGDEGDLVTSDAQQVMTLLGDLQREKLALQGQQGTTIIQDNSQNVSNQSQPLVLPTPEISPGNYENTMAVARRALIQG